MASRARCVVVAGVVLTACATAVPRLPSREPGPAAGLEALLERRAAPIDHGNYHVGPGDVLALRVLGSTELTQSFRVSQRGMLVLPLVGSVPVEGLTEREAAARVAQALSEFLIDPQVTVSVGEFEGQRVCVVGAVGHPGVYALRGSNQTIADVLTEAGGITSDAGTGMYLAPVREGDDGGQMEALARLDAAAAFDVARGRRDAFEIDLIRLYQGRNVPELAAPVRGGDTLIVPPFGDVYVEGWVEHPGGYRLSHGTTLNGAISRAGGLAFPAARGRVRLKRLRRDGHLETFSVDYPGIVGGQEADPYLETGDRIEIAANPLKLVPWGLYRFVTSIFRIGVSGHTPVVEP
jgi:polysaccharide export outer membrane protein